ncbi:hypothetical protein PR048_025868 [Dryococelus australis]|uniref:Uncharacterized protein n=1 Tax=Dryococelus australis TaxID=614101 RepID=A0ABQ9GJR6_9NEOP|nr:hypothetical protein PR048_025868 [Dryococelus australis]
MLEQNENGEVAERQKKMVMLVLQTDLANVWNVFRLLLMMMMMMMIMEDKKNLQETTSELRVPNSGQTVLATSMPHPSTSTVTHHYNYMLLLNATVLERWLDARSRAYTKAGRIRPSGGHEIFDQSQGNTSIRPSVQYWNKESDYWASRTHTLPHFSSAFKRPLKTAALLHKVSECVHVAWSNKRPQSSIESSNDLHHAARNSVLGFPAGLLLVDSRPVRVQQTVCRQKRKLYGRLFTIKRLKDIHGDESNHRGAILPSKDGATVTALVHGYRKLQNNGPGLGWSSVRQTGQEAGASIPSDKYIRFLRGMLHANPVFTIQRRGRGKRRKFAATNRLRFLWLGRTFSRVGIVPDDDVGRWVFSGICCFPRPLNPALHHTHLALPSSALKISMLSAAQFSSLAIERQRFGGIRCYRLWCDFMSRSTAGKTKICDDRVVFRRRRRPDWLMVMASRRVVALMAISHLMHVAVSPLLLPRFSASQADNASGRRSETEKSLSDKGDSATSTMYTIVTKRNTLDWRAVFSSQCVYLWDFQQCQVGEEKRGWRIIGRVQECMPVSTLNMEMLVCLVCIRACGGRNPSSVLLGQLLRLVVLRHAEAQCDLGQLSLVFYNTSQGIEHKLRVLETQGAILPAAAGGAAHETPRREDRNPWSAIDARRESVAERAVLLRRDKG